MGMAKVPIVKTPSEWQKDHGFIVLVSDGWDMPGDARSWGEPITEDEFIRRAENSTIRYPGAGPQQGITRPHSRACDYRMHNHGRGCHRSCPTCGGQDLPVEQTPPETVATPTPSYDEAVHELCEAIRLTVEYLGTERLPAVDGWSWYDALKKYAPGDAERFRNEYVTRRRDEETRRAADREADEAIAAALVASLGYTEQEAADWVKTQRGHRRGTDLEQRLNRVGKLLEAWETGKAGSMFPDDYRAMQWAAQCLRNAWNGT